MGILGRLRGLLGREPELFNLRIQPAYAIKASRNNPYFQALEHQAREAGFFGDFVVEHDGALRAGESPTLETRGATLTLDVYPAPAVIEGRRITDYEAADGPRRQPRAALALDGGGELLLWRDGDRLRVAGEAIGRAQERRAGG